MTRKKKRGTSSSSKDGGRGRKKIEVVPRSPGSGSTSSRGKDREKVDPTTNKMNKALESAYKLSSACKQHTLADVKKVTWHLETDEDGVIKDSYAGFKSVLVKRRKLFKNTMSLRIRGVAVTQPKPSETYHIIEIKVDNKTVLELLFRNSDGYLIAFRHVSTDVDNPIWEGWYYFNDDDLSLPPFCKDKAMLGIESGYTRFLEVRFGEGIVSSVVNCLLAFTKDNCTQRTYGDHNRVVVLETLMVFFGECQRSGLFLEYAKLHYTSSPPVEVT